MRPNAHIEQGHWVLVSGPLLTGLTNDRPAVSCALQMGHLPPNLVFMIVNVSEYLSE